MSLPIRVKIHTRKAAKFPYDAHSVMKILNEYGYDFSCSPTAEECCQAPHAYWYIDTGARMFGCGKTAEHFAKSDNVQIDASALQNYLASIHNNPEHKMETRLEHIVALITNEAGAYRALKPALANKKCFQRWVHYWTNKLYKDVPGWATGFATYDDIALELLKYYADEFHEAGIMLSVMRRVDEPLTTKQIEEARNEARNHALDAAVYTMPTITSHSNTVHEEPTITQQKIDRLCREILLQSVVKPIDPNKPFKLPKLHTQEPEPMFDIETRTFINGENAANMTDKQIFANIAVIEKEIEKLEAVKRKPKKLTSEIERLNKVAEDLAAYVDSRS